MSQILISVRVGLILQKAFIVQMPIVDQEVINTYYECEETN